MSATDLYGSGTITALNGNVAVACSGYNTILFNVLGTWSAVLSIQATIDGTNWFYIEGMSPQSTNIFTAFAGNLQILISCGGYSQVQIIATSFSSGTVSITYNASVGSNLDLNVPQGVVTTSPPSYTVGNIAQLSLNTGGGLRTEKMLSTRQYYGVGTGTFTPPATPTDIATITGSATKTIRVTKLEISTTQSTAGVNTWFIIVRSAANSGGTSATPAIVPLDSNNSVATAVVRNYTANPSSLGSSVGTIRTTRLLADSLTTTSQNVYTFDFTNSGISSGIVLRGTSQVLSLNFNGATLPLGLSVACNFEWSEE